MDIQKLIERSRAAFETDPQKISCLNDESPLIVVRAKPQLRLEAIWVKPVDDFEGPLYQEYIKENPKYRSVFLRQAVAKRLYGAAEGLPKHLKLVLRAGHRPIAVQNKLLQALIDKYCAENPGCKKDEALTYARTYVSDPSIQLPPHCCGAAVDVDVMDVNTGKLLDFGCSVNTDSAIAFLHTSGINKQQYANRMMLLTAMLKAGFAPCFTEWWHFSYGDMTWAYFYEQPKILYGIVEPNL